MTISLFVFAGLLVAAIAAVIFFARREAEASTREQLTLQHTADTMEIINDEIKAKDRERVQATADYDAYRREHPLPSDPGPIHPQQWANAVDDDRHGYDAHVAAGDSWTDDSEPAGNDTPANDGGDSVRSGAEDVRIGDCGPESPSFDSPASECSAPDAASRSEA